MLRLRACATSVLAATMCVVVAQPRAQGGSATRSDAQAAFDMLKSFAGTWVGQGPDGAVHISWRVTSGGAAILQEMVPEGRRNDPANGDDDPITMIYIDDGRLILTMYCDTFKNRPRMIGKLSPDGTTVTFDFLDVAGGGAGYMNAAVFTAIDRDHHSEEWGVLAPGGRSMRARMHLVRAR